MAGHTDWHRQGAAFNSTYVQDSNKTQAAKCLAEAEGQRCRHTHNSPIPLPTSQALFLTPQVSYSLPGPARCLLAKRDVHLLLWDRGWDYAESQLRKDLMRTWDRLQWSGAGLGQTGITTIHTFHVTSPFYTPFIPPWPPSPAHSLISWHSPTDTLPPCPQHPRPSSFHTYLSGTSLLFLTWMCSITEVKQLHIWDS